MTHELVRFLLSAFRFFLLSAALLPALSARAQFGYNDSVGITVTGAGEVRVMPNLVEIDLNASGSAELTSDAIVKYQDARRRTMEAFDKLKLPNLKIEEGGLSISGTMTQQQMQMMQQGMQTGAAMKVPVEIGCPMRLTIRDIQGTPPLKLMETIGTVLDVAKDSGAAVGSGGNRQNWGYDYSQNGRPLARFVLEDFKPKREEAYKLAVADARARAQRLADLSGVQLGAVVGVQESQVSGDENDPTQQVYVNNGYAMQAPIAPKTARIVIDRFEEIPIRVRLAVRFALDTDKPKVAGK